MNQRISVATIDNPEFINLQPFDKSPLMSKCEIKVFYIGQNRNGSAINKETATKMSKTLRGCPIVGYYKEENQDFRDHGDQLVLDGDGAHFNCLTKPYGFIAPDAKVWFQFFEDTDEFGNSCMREYLVAEGYLWTSQYPEAQRAIDNHNPQSMELDEESLKGHWATDNNSGLEFFIINDAIFSKLCILGEDVEPCFEGAMVTEPTTSSSFSLDKNFLNEMKKMIDELKFALNNSEGGLSMENQATPIAEVQVEETVTETPATENFSSEQDNSGETPTVENENSTEEFEKKEKEDPASQEEESKEGEKESSEEDKDDDEEKKANAKNSLEEDYEKLQTEFSELQNKYSSLEEENKVLLAFKADVENKQKDELINSFYMLTDEDKKDVIENKTQYSLEEIESKLSVICVRKKVSFDLAQDKQTPEENTPATTFNLNETQVDSLPAWLRAVEDVKNNKDN